MNDAAITLLTNRCIKQDQGARVVNRIVERDISKHLAKEMLWGRLEHGGAVMISTRDQDLHFEYLVDNREVALVGQETLDLETVV